MNFIDLISPPRIRAAKNAIAEFKGGQYTKKLKQKIRTKNESKDKKTK